MLEWPTKWVKPRTLRKFLYALVFFQTKENKPLFATCTASFPQAGFEFP